MLIKKIIKKIGFKKLLPIILLVVIFVPSSFASADLFELATTFNCWTSLIDCTVSWVQGVVINLIALVGSGVDVALNFHMNNSVVTSSWEISRNFANMFFIVALIIMAFATIFDISSYNFRTLIARFLIAALLINFSLVIGQTIIDLSQSLSGVFIQAIGNVGNRIAQGAQLGLRLDQTELGTVQSALANITWTGTMVIVANIILLSIVLFSLIVLLFFSIIRIPILWVLLILSPIAWIASILPQTKQYHSRWWTYFMSWNLFTPIYLFFIYFGVLFLNNQQEVIGSVSSVTLTPGSNISFETIFFYIMIGFFLIGGAKVAMSTSRAGGAGIVAGSVWARGRATARFAGAGAMYGASRARLPYFWGNPLKRDSWGLTPSAKSISGAANARMEQAKREGVFGIGGTENIARRQSQVAQSFGVRGAAQAQSQKDIQIFEERYRKEGKNEQMLNTILNNPDSSLEERIAAANIIKSQYRALRGNEVKGLYEEYNRISPAEAAKWIRGQKDAIEGLDKRGLDELEATADPQMKQFIARIKAKREIIPSIEDWQNKLNYFTAGNGGNDASMASFISESKEFIEKLDIDSAMRLLNSDSIPKENRESTKKLAYLIAKKGIDTDALLRLTKEGGAFESQSEIEKFLDTASEGNMSGALRAKFEAGVLRDLVTKEKFDNKTADRDASVKIVIKQGYGKLAPKVIAERPMRVSADPNKQLGLGNDFELEAFKEYLNDVKPERIQDFYRSDEFVGNKELFGRVDSHMGKVRYKNLINPFNELTKKILGLVPEIKTAKDNSDKAKTNGLIIQAQTALATAKRLYKSIVEGTTDEKTRNEADRAITEAESELKEAQEYKKQL